MITAEFYFAGPFTGKNEDEIISKLKSGNNLTMWESNEEYMMNLRERLMKSNGLDDGDITLDSSEAFLNDLESLGIARLSRDGA